MEELNYVLWFDQKRLSLKVYDLKKFDECALTIQIVEMFYALKSYSIGHYLRK
jgi:hypothetical protein